MSDYPIDEVLRNMERLARQGAECYVKFTCFGCGSRQTSDTPNVYSTGGYTCEECRVLTIPTGINFLLVWPTSKGDV